MQSLNFSLSPTNQTMPLNIEASGLWYESGTSAVNTRIVVSPEVGGDIELKPGQRVKMTALSKSWRIRSLDPAATITGKILIGSGEFEDNSSLVTLDASFANNVTIMNANVPVTVSGGDVEIKNDAGNPIPTTATITGTPTVTIAGTANVQENLIAITNSFSSSQTFTVQGLQLIAPASNTNGVIIQSCKLYGNGTNSYSLIAKSTAPAGDFDGVVIAHVPAATTAAQFVEMAQKLKIPAGLGLYFFAQTTSANPVRIVNASIL